MRSGASNGGCAPWYLSRPADLEGTVRERYPTRDYHPETTGLPLPGPCRIVVNRCAEAATAKWVEDVRVRKLCIANGEGQVHGIGYDLEGQFGIGLRRVV